MDPDNRNVSHGSRRLRWATRGALVWGVGYLVWRAGFTVLPADQPAAGLLWLAEALALVVFAGRVRQASTEPLDVVVVPDVPPPDTTAVIDATGASAQDLRITLVALRRVEGLTHTVVVDRAGSRWLRGVAERFGVGIAGTDHHVDDPVRGAATAWVLMVRAGDLPMPDLVRVCATRCSAPDVAVVQVGIEEADPTSFEHDPTGRWSLEPYQHRVVRPSLAARGPIPWWGDGPALVRRDAVTSLADAPPGLWDHSPEIGLRLVAAGWSVTQVPMTLARVQGPRGLGDCLVRRHRRSARAVRALRPELLGGVPRPVRVAHLLALLPTLAAVQRLLLVASAVFVLGAAQVPMVAAPLDLALLAVPAYLSRWNAQLLLGRGRLGPLSIMRNELRSLGVDLWPFGRIRPEAARAGLPGLVGVVVVLDAVVVVTAVSMWRNWADRLPVTVAVTALVLAAGFLGVAVEVLLDALGRRQRRDGHRVRLGIVTCRIEEHDGQLVDLSLGGAGLVVAAPPEATPPPGTVTTVGFRVPDADGAWRSVSALVHVVHRDAEPGGGTRIGLAFDDPTAAGLDPVVEFLTVDRRLVALGRHERAAR